MTRRLKYETLEPRLLLAADIRTIDGHNNNLANPDWGAADTQLIRQAPADYADDVSAPAGADRPSARAVSNAVHDQAVSMTSARNLTSYVFQWGQFVDHDIDLTEPHDPAEPFNIPVPTGDMYFDPAATGTQVIPLNRSIYDTSTGTDPSNPRQQINEITSYIDASNVYGSDDVRAEALRTGEGGRLKTSAGDLLPFNVDGLPNAGGPSPSLFLAGDVRANEQLALTAIHNLFVREHNRLADEISAADPDLSDEEIYQAARRIVGAEIQAITYREFLPAVLGPRGIAEFGGYDDTVNAGISNEFSTAAYRVGHTMLPSELLRLDADGNEIPEGNLALRDAFFRPDRLINEGGIEPFLKGLAAQVQQEVDAFVIDDVRNFLFGPPGAGGFDLASLNIQRGRDHGMPSYNDARVAFGLAPVTTFSQISSNSDVQARLASVYSDVNEVDFWTGGIAEDHLAGSSLGELFTVIWADQFERSRDGDRFYYQNDGILSSDELAELENTRLSDIIRRNTPITDIQDEVFRAESVLVYRAPFGDGGADVTLQVHGNRVQVVSNADGTVLASQRMSDTSSVVLFGTDADDHFVVETKRLNVTVEVHGWAGDDHLKLVGTGGKDVITVADVQATVNGNDLFYGSIESVSVDAGNGRDFAAVIGAPSADVILNGGRGRDILLGGSSRDVLVGGRGNDILLGGGGNDVLIGGFGRDILLGGTGEDILIDESYVLQDDDDALLEVLAIWNSGLSQSDREDLLSADLLASDKLVEDHAIDFVLGGLGDDWRL